MQQKELLTRMDVASIGEAIDHELAKKMIKTYKETYPESFTGVAIGRNIIEQVLAQPGCVGIRFYDAINEVGQKTLVYVGIDAAGKDVLEHVVVNQNGTISVDPVTVGDRGWESWDYLGNL
jgi:hypothetical protein